MMLTNRQLGAILKKVLDVDVQEFSEELKLHFPKRMMDELLDANIESAIKRFPFLGIDTQRQIAAFGMAGFQMGWLLHKEVMNGR
jgi:hypothetical protein